jgi:hypothetical protein
MGVGFQGIRRRVQRFLLLEALMFVSCRWVDRFFPSCRGPFDTTFGMYDFFVTAPSELEMRFPWAAIFIVLWRPLPWLRCPPLSWGRAEPQKFYRTLRSFDVTRFAIWKLFDCSMRVVAETGDREKMVRRALRAAVDTLCVAALTYSAAKYAPRLCGWFGRDGGSLYGAFAVVSAFF